MKISEVIDTIKAEILLGRTPSGRSITEYGKNALDATLQDTKNMGMSAIKCLNCNIIISSLLVPEGCVNCGSKDMTLNIKKSDIL